VENICFVDLDQGSLNFFVGLSLISITLKKVERHFHEFLNIVLLDMLLSPNLEREIHSRILHILFLKKGTKYGAKLKLRSQIEIYI
jgi:hypothetical protein